MTDTPTTEAPTLSEVGPAPEVPSDPPAPGSSRDADAAGNAVDAAAATDDQHQDGADPKDGAIVGRAGRRARSEPSAKPFQLAVCCGVPTEMGESIADSTVVVDPADPAGSLGRAGLGAPDLRARAIVLVDGPVLDSVAAYVTVCGLASRFLDAATPAGVILSERHGDGRNLSDAGKAPTRADLVVISVQGAPAMDDAAAASLVLGDEPASVLHYELVDRHLDHLSPAEVSELRSARRVLLVLPTTLDDALFAVLYTAGVRARKDFERLPAVAVDGKVVDLDELRRSGGALRRAQRRADGAVAEVAESTDRQRHLNEAAAVAIEPVLTALGSHHDGDLWSCPRPWSHNHGDATPSMQVGENKVRCHVDDAEWIDPLRLVIECCGVTPDEAAALLLGPSGFFAPFRDRIVAERERRAATA